MIADQRVIENIKKLNNLGMSKNDIKDNLLKMGLNDSDCDQLIKQALENFKIKNKKETKSNQDIITKNKLPEKETLKPKKKEELPPNLFSTKKQIKKDEIEKIKNKSPKLETETKEDIDISKGLDLDEFNKINITKEYEDKPNQKKYKIKDNDDFLKDLENTFNDEIEPTPEINNNKDNFNFNINTNNNDYPSQESNIWQSGLITTINSKLNDIENKQTQIEQYLKARIDSEINRSKKIQDTTRQLLIGKVNDLIQEEGSKIEQLVTRQLAHIKVEQAKLNKKINEIDNGKEEITSIIKEVEDMKSNVFQENTKAQNEMKKVAATTSIKLNAKMKQINEILTLQSRISQGLVKNTQEAINKEILKLNQFKEGVNSQINPHKLYDKLNEIEKFKEQLAARYENRFENVKIEFLKKAQEAFKDKIEEELKDIKKYRNEIANKTDPEIINKKIEELEIFEKHLLNNIDEKISQSLKIYESGITQEFKNKINKLDDYYKKVESLIARIEMTQDTIKEINNFKDQFIAIVDKNIEKMNYTMGLIDNKLKELSKLNSNNNTNKTNTTKINKFEN